MFRQPEQRVLSAWHDNFRVFRADPFPVSACRNETFTKELPMETFTSRWGSWETGQIVGKGQGLFGEMTVSADDVPKALERSLDDFSAASKKALRSWAFKKNGSLRFGGRDGRN
ncbi:unnamed protein product [Durusdinium trenchii]|uniref:Uncharacterized protein n=1 Tax=Durusdinium trenchii TaxID=1381693 RepID=A0ABP0NAN8_9DINO